MIYEIKRNAVTIASIQPEGNITRKIMGEELVNMTFTLTQIIGFQINDTVLVYGNTYVLQKEPNIAKISTKEYQYTLQFTSVKYELAKVQMFFPDVNDNLTLSEFSITGTAELMIDLLVQNANRIQTGWVKGVIDVTDAKTVSFSKDNCLSALAKIAEEFEIEYWVDGNKTISLTERKAVSGLTLEYGKNKGLVNLTRTVFDNSNICTRLYARGSKDNIARDYRNYSEHLLIPEPNIYLEKNVAKYGIIEHIEVFEDIRPEYIGTVTAVDANNPLSFTDANLDFDLNETDANGSVILIDSVPAKVSFLTGQMAGYTFEIKEYGFVSLTKTFELLVNEDEKAFEIPSDIIRPEIGDTYVLLDIKMPIAYVTDAENRLLVAAQKYIDENSEQQVKYAANADRLYLRSINADITLGNTINFKDTDFNLDDNLRVVGLVKDLQDEFNVSFDIANKAVLSTIVRDYIEDEKEAAIINRSITVNAQQARRNYLYSKELRETLFDPDGYFDTDNIKPLSIETSMLSVGSKSRQFIIEDLLIEPNYTGLVDKIRCGNGTLVHFTIDENALKSWDLIGNIFNLPANSGAHYIYAKCPVAGTQGEFLVTTQQFNTEVGNFYYFIIGVVHTAVADVRGVSLTYGQTTINGKFITTGKIQSSDALNFVDLDNNSFHFGDANTYLDWNNLEAGKLKVSEAVIDKSLMSKNFWAEEATIADWEVKNGKITSKNEYNGNPRAQFDGNDGKIIVRSPKTIYNANGTQSEIEQLIEIDSLEGRVKATHQGTASQVAGTTVLDSEGVYVDFAGVQAQSIQAGDGLNIKASIAGLGRGNLVGSSGNTASVIAGIFGKATNSANNPAPTFGGYFIDLFARGLNFNLNLLTSSQTTFTFNSSVVLLSCYNSAGATVYLTANPNRGLVHYVKRINGGVTVDGNGNNIMRASAVTSTALPDGNLYMFIFDSVNWLCGRMFN